MTNSSLFPKTGNLSSNFIPDDGILSCEMLRQDDEMDSLDALRRNLTALMDAATDGLRSGPAGVLALEAATDIGKSTLYRILDPRVKNPAQLDTLERIAQAYSLQVWQLLVPRLDPLDPPEFIGSRQMSVLRSVFAQTQSVAFGHGSSTVGGVESGSVGAQRKRDGTHPTGHRVHAGGNPADDAAVAKRPRKTK